MLLKSEDKQNLYYNEYRYKVSVQAPNLNRIQWCRTYAEFLTKLEEAKDSVFINRRTANMTPAQLVLVENIIEYRNKVKKKFDITTRQEFDSLAFYSNDLELLKEVWRFSPYSVITEVHVMPPGVITFAREPKHRYRVYLKGDKIERELRDDLIEYLGRTRDAYPCNALEAWLKRDHRFSYLYSNDKHFIDYDEPSTLTMMHLIIPKLVGKSYKLERK